jgi:hypothetical protein
VAKRPRDRGASAVLFGKPLTIESALAAIE